MWIDWLDTIATGLSALYQGLLLFFACKLTRKMAFVSACFYHTGKQGEKDRRKLRQEEIEKERKKERK